MKFVKKLITPSGTVQVGDKLKKPAEIFNWISTDELNDQLSAGALKFADAVNTFTVMVNASDTVKLIVVKPREESWKLKIPCKIGKEEVSLDIDTVRELLRRQKGYKNFYACAIRGDRLGAPIDCPTEESAEIRPQFLNAQSAAFFHTVYNEVVALEKSCESDPELDRLRLYRARFCKLFNMFSSGRVTPADLIRLRNTPGDSGILERVVDIKEDYGWANNVAEELVLKALGI